MDKSWDDPLIILASKSPRRRHLLKQAGIVFRVIPSSIDETSIKITAPETYVKALSEAKAWDVAEKYPHKWVIGADTIVLKDNIVLGKPGSRSEARAMLEHLNGQTHKVLTGYAICCKARNRLFSETIITDVRFKRLSDQEIEWYIHTQEPFDKAGGYAIQGLGTFLVKSIKGSYTNVVGLPVCEVMEFLIKEGVLALSRNHKE
jgi:septum formation protein